MTTDVQTQRRRATEPEASRRRRAVHQALAPFLQGEELAEALWLWEEGAGNGPAFALHDYVARLCARPGLSELRAAVHLSLVRSMTLPLTQLGPDPWPLMQATRRGLPVQSAPPAPAGEPEGSVVFEHVLDRLFQALGERQPDGVGRIRAWLQRRLGSRLDVVGLDAAAAARIVLWLNGSASSIGVPLPARALRSLLHAVYVLACEYYGPVLTDGLLADAVRSAETLPEARRFPPRRLL